MNNKKKFNFSGIAAFIIAVLLLLVLVPINIIFSYNDKKFDMTEKSQYTFTDTTLQLLEETKDKQIEIYFLCPLDYLRDAPEYLPLYYQLTELDKRDNITLKCEDLDANPQLQSILNPAGNINLQFSDIVVRCNGLIKHIARDRIFPYTYVNDSSDNAMVTYAGEELLAGAIKIVTGGSLPTIYFMTGHGEPEIDGNYATISKQLKTDNYDVLPLDLSAEQKVPENAAIVVLSGPTSDISSDEADKLLAYAGNGGNMAFLIPPCETEGRFDNIEKVLEKFELGIDYNIVTETVASRMMNNRDYEQDAHYFNVTYTPATDDFVVDLTSEINSLVNNGIQGGISNTRSLYQINSTGSGSIEKSSIITATPGDEGYTTNSAPFGGNDETAADAEKLNGQTVKLELAFYSYNKTNGSKLVAFGTDDIINSENISDSVSLSQQLFLNSVTWMYNPDVNMNIGNKDSSYDYLTFKNAEEATSTLRIFTIVPFVIAAFGLFVWLKRRHS